MEFVAGSPLSGNWLHDLTHAKTPQPSGPDAPADSLAADSLGGAMRLMQRFGLPLLAGTDAAPWGFSLHAELAIYVAEGLTPLNALQSATLNPAKMLRATDSLGTVAPGKLADLVLLDANPLADITNTTTIRAVVANGRYFGRPALDSLLAEVQLNFRQHGCHC
jgi:imidazolonepropionase-like amidohydrolase